MNDITKEIIKLTSDIDIELVDTFLASPNVTINLEYLLMQYANSNPENIQELIKYINKLTIIALNKKDNLINSFESGINNLFHLVRTRKPNQSFVPSALEIMVSYFKDGTSNGASPDGVYFYNFFKDSLMLNPKHFLDYDIGMFKDHHNWLVKFCTINNIPIE